MSQNLISAKLTDEDANAVKQHIGEIRNTLSFLLSLSASDIGSIIKLGNALLPFIEKGHETLTSHPEIMPGVFDKEEYQRDYALLKQINPILSQINELKEGIEKTYYAVGSDVLVSTLEIYAQVKANKGKVPGLNVVADEMAVFFKKSKAQTKTTQP